VCRTRPYRIAVIAANPASLEDKASGKEEQCETQPDLCHLIAQIVGGVGISSGVAGFRVGFPKLYLFLNTIFNF